MSFELAQFNVARCRWPLDDTRMAGFTDELDRVNALADASEGFVWRLQDDTGTATSIRPYDDAEVIVNLSVWRTPAALRAYAYRTDHAELLRRRRDWFTPMGGPTLVMWWVSAGTRPTVFEGKARLDRLAGRGPTADGFTFARRFPPPSLVGAEDG